tara:strand:+ start:290 stop:670 length:381 start_codon:yes stop_codon:yes gene_type:complete
MRKLSEADIRLIMESGDVTEAIEVLREGMKASQSIRATGDNGQRIYKQVPDHGTRITCARLLLEWGFGKPAQTTKLEIDKKETLIETPAQIIEKMKLANVDVEGVAKTYLEVENERVRSESEPTDN